MEKGELVDWRKSIVDNTISFMECAYFRGVSLAISAQRGRSHINYFDGVSINPKYLKMLCETLDSVDIGRVCVLALDVRTPLNILYSGEFPHNEKTLQSHLGFKNRQMMVDFANKLIEMGVILKVKTLVGIKRPVFIMNPYLVFRGNLVDNQALDFFGEYEAV